MAASWPKNCTIFNSASIINSDEVNWFLSFVTGRIVNLRLSGCTCVKKGSVLPELDHL